MKNFLRRYWRWIASLVLSNIAIWLTFEHVHSQTLGFSDLWLVRMYLLSGSLLFDNLCVLWWYADSTKQLAISGEAQRQAGDQQLAIAKAQLTESERRSLIAQKPIVFTDRIDDPNREGNAHYVAHNVGGGFAVNVYYFDVTVTNPISIGSLAAGEERPLPAGLNRSLQQGGGGVRHLLIAEAPYTRTTQWTPTLNFRTQEAGDHKGHIIHRTASVTVEPQRFQYQDLPDYLHANAQAFRNQLKALANDEVASA